MSIATYRAAATAAFQAALPDLRTCRAHPGRFDVGEVKRWALAAPSVLVACLAIPSAKDYGGGRQANCSWAAFVITRDKVGSGKDAQALAIVETLLHRILDNAWDADHSASEVSAENHFSGTIDKIGVAIWSVAWKAAVELEFSPGLAELDDFETLRAQYDLAPEHDGQIEAEDLVTLQGSFMASYGQIHVSTAAATSVATPGSYVKAAGTTEEDLVEGFDMTASNRLAFSGTVPTPVMASASCSVSVSVDTTISLALAKNGTVDLDTVVQRKLTAGDIDACSVQGILSLDENDYVELWLTAADVVGVTVENMTLVARAA